MQFFRHRVRSLLRWTRASSSTSPHRKVARVREKIHLYQLPTKNLNQLNWCGYLPAFMFLESRWSSVYSPVQSTNFSKSEDMDTAASNHKWIADRVYPSIMFYASSIKAAYLGTQLSRDGTLSRSSDTAFNLNVLGQTSNNNGPFHYLAMRKLSSSSFLFVQGFALELALPVSYYGGVNNRPTCFGLDTF